MNETDNHNPLEDDWDGDWNNALETLSNKERGDANFEVVASRVTKVVKDWLDSPVYAATGGPHEPMLIGSSDFDNAKKTRLGEVAAVQVLGLMSMLCVKSEIRLDPKVIFENKKLILECVEAMMVEGVLMANSIEWCEQMDTALGDVRESRWGPIAYSPNGDIIKMRDEPTTEEDPGITEA
jgi:hypothetical protein